FLSISISRSINHLSVIFPGEFSIGNLIFLVVLPSTFNIVVNVSLLHKVNMFFKFIFLDKSISVQVHLGDELAEIYYIFIVIYEIWFIDLRSEVYIFSAQNDLKAVNQGSARRFLFVYCIL